jgi:hypothetical protein
MGKFGHALSGSLLGAVAVVALFAALLYFVPMDYMTAGVIFFVGCWFTFIGWMLAALGGLAVERRTRERHEQDQQQPK